MKDLKHMIFFEDLLQQSHNALVQQATDEGQLALGYNCYYIPEVLLNLKGCFSTRLRAPNSGTAEIASYYMTNRNCPYVRCILERAIEGGFNYLNALFGAEGCAAMERMEEHFALLHPVQNDRFFTTIIDPPMKGDKTSLDYYKAQLQLKVLDALHEHYGVDVSDEALRLIRVTQQSFFEGIKFAREGCRLSDISAAVQAYVEANGFSIVREYVGHGIGRRMHEPPEVPNYGKPGHGPRLLRGMTIAVEPMVNAGSAAIAQMPDGWTVKTADGKNAAHYENTILITAGEPELLTDPEKSLV